MYQDDVDDPEAVEENESRQVDEQDETSMDDFPEVEQFVKPETDEEAMDNLRQLFSQMMELLDLKYDGSEGDSPEKSCKKLLYTNGDEPAADNNSTNLETFRTNIASVLRLFVRLDTLEKAYENAGSVDEALFNLLQRPLNQELHQI